MGLFVGTARLNACHSLTDQLGSAESPIGVEEHSRQVSPQTTNTLTHISVLQEPLPTYSCFILFLHHSQTA